MFSQLTFLSLKTYFWTNIAIPMFIGIKGVNGNNQKPYIVVPIIANRGIANTIPTPIKPLPLIINQVINNAHPPLRLTVDVMTAHYAIKNSITDDGTRPCDEGDGG